MLRVAIASSDKAAKKEFEARLRQLAEQQGITVEIESFGKDNAWNHDYYPNFDLLVTDSFEIADSMKEAITNQISKQRYPKVIFFQPEVFFQTLKGRQKLDWQILVPCSDNAMVDSFLLSTITSSELSQTIFVKSQGKEIRLRIDEILHIDQMLKRCIITCIDRVIETQTSLDRLEKEINSRWFMRVDITLLVNKAHIIEHNRVSKTFSMDDGSQIDYMSKKRPSPYEVFPSAKEIL